MGNAFERVGSYTSLMEAQQVCSYLKSHGIETHIPDENAASMMSHMLPLFGHVSVLVATENIELSRKLLEGFVTAQLPEQHEGLAKRALLSAIFGVTFLPLVATGYSFFLCFKFLNTGVTKVDRSTIQVLTALVINLLAVVFAGILFSLWTR